MEKRRGKRYKKRFTIKFGIQDTKAVGFVEDISSTGLRIKTATVFKPGLTLKMEIFNESTDQVMYAEGVIMWAIKVPPDMMRKKRCGMGVTYLKFDSNMHAFLVDLLKKDEAGSG